MEQQLVVCVGAAKAGTTSLHALMRQHPQVCATNVKETDFFHDEKLYARGYSDYRQRYFTERADAPVLFEANPIYMYATGCIERIQSCAPDARIVVILRNPVDRAFSQYAYRMRYRRYSESFVEMCRKEAERIKHDEQSRLEYGCLDRSRYAVQLRKIYEYVPPERVYVMVFERFIADQEGEFNKLLDWLGLQRIQGIAPVRENEGGTVRNVWLARLMYHTPFRRLRGLIGKLFPRASWKRATYKMLEKFNTKSFDKKSRPVLDKDVRAELLAEFDKDIRETESLTRLDLGLWRKAS